MPPSITITAENNVHAPGVLQNFIGGKFTPSTSAKASIPVTNPATGTIISYVPVSDARDVDDAVNAAKFCFATKWGKTTIKTRILKLMKLHSLIMTKLDDLVAIIVQEHGKNVVEVKIYTLIVNLLG
jgi:malonate-semialdehyde dehydrogenase (acetylating) / methylmalonate-semialdehyde dehydrogenase